MVSAHQAIETVAMLVGIAPLLLLQQQESSIHVSLEERLISVNLLDLTKGLQSKVHEC